MESIIASSHHYYVAFFSASALKSVNQLVSLLRGTRTNKYVSHSKIVHIYVNMEKALGSEKLLYNNRVNSSNGGILYAYDLYVGEGVYSGKKVFYVCYPYSKLSSYVSDHLKSSFSDLVFYKAVVSEVLRYMQLRKTNGYAKFELSGNSVDITKYSAEVKEEANANTVSLFGTNPLDSKIYDLLSSKKEISIEPIALKLKCETANGEYIELAFDRLGNYRFWLGRDLQEMMIPMLPKTLAFFNEIDSIKTSFFITSQTFLEDE